MSRLFFFPIETCPRELNYKRFVSKSIFKDGDIHIFARPWVLQMLSRIFKNINWFGQNCFERSRFFKTTTVEELRKKNGKLFYFDEEGGVYPINDAENIFNKRYKNKNLTAEDIVFSWGAKQEELLNNLKIKNFMAGHPKFIRSSLENIKSKTSNSEKATLILTNFTIIFSKNNFEKWFEKDVYSNFISTNLKNASKLMSLVNKLEGKIHIRIHPSEDMKLYQKIFKNINNVEILPREDLIQSLQRANNVYHFNCTTAVDAFFHNITVKNMADGSYTIVNDIPENTDHDLDSLWLNDPFDLELFTTTLNDNAKDYVMHKFFLRNMVYFYAIIFETIYKTLSLFGLRHYQDAKFGEFNKNSNVSFFDVEIVS